MAIYCETDQDLFHLQTTQVSYIVQVVEGTLMHIYWGRRMDHDPDMGHWYMDQSNDRLNRGQLEYPQFGTGDYRHPAIQVEQMNGSRITDFKFQGFKLKDVKTKRYALPQLFTESRGETQVLTIQLIDACTGVVLDLNYAINHESDALTRSASIENQGSEDIRLIKAVSCSVDFSHSHFERISLIGASRRERFVQRNLLQGGSQSVESRRGASSHHANPFMALADPVTTEDFGDVYAVALLYSGSHKIEAEVSQHELTRLSAGIHPDDFTWTLHPGDIFQTPESVLVFSNEGIGGMSRIFHDLIRDHLIPERFRNADKKVVVNSWEAAYFDFNEEKLIQLAKSGKAVGADLFVLDDGWFGKRNDDTSSLGDWIVNQEKLPSGLKGFTDQLKKEGLSFGLWIEPEMISPDSDLYRRHPDWCIHVPDRTRHTFRHQLVLDLTNPEVIDYVWKVIDDILSSAPVHYLKWDMNRNLMDRGSAWLPDYSQQELPHRYIMGLYTLLEKITESHPHVVIEGCAGGGGRFDLGMLYYVPQIWTSDNTDAMDRLYIQHGTSLIYPFSVMGAHVTDSPNHQTLRSMDLNARASVAIPGIFGFELDLNDKTARELDEMIIWTDWWKSIRHICHEGDVYRLKSPFISHETAWLFVSKDQSECLLLHWTIRSQVNRNASLLKLAGLDPSGYYFDQEEKRIWKGDQLMNRGLKIPAEAGDMKVTIKHLVQTNGQN